MPDNIRQGLASIARAFAPLEEAIAAEARGELDLAPEDWAQGYYSDNDAGWDDPDA